MAASRAGWSHRQGPPARGDDSHLASPSCRSSAGRGSRKPRWWSGATRRCPFVVSHWGLDFLSSQYLDRMFGRVAGKVLWHFALRTSGSLGLGLEAGASCKGTTRCIISQSKTLRERERERER